MKRMFHVFAEKDDPRNPDRILELPVGVAFSSDGSRIFRIRLDSIPLQFTGSLLVHLDDPVSEIPEKDHPRGEAEHG